MKGFTLCIILPVPVSRAFQVQFMEFGIMDIILHIFSTVFSFSYFFSDLIMLIHIILKRFPERIVRMYGLNDLLGIIKIHHQPQAEYLLSLFLVYRLYLHSMAGEILHDLLGQKPV